MRPPFDPPRPGILLFLGLVSLIWSALTLVGGLVIAGIALAVGLGSWLGGPIAGAVGSILGLVVAGWIVLSSILSLLLFVAGWRTLRGDPSGIALHRTWAWISLALDAVALLASAGASPTNWGGLIYALIVLYAINLPEVVAHAHGGGPAVGPGKPPAWDDERF